MKAALKLNHRSEQDLVEAMASFQHDPYGWVLFSFPWGEGELSEFDGPDAWQVDLLQDIGRGILTVNEAIQIAISSGHGIGKSALVAWLILWGLSTFEDTKGVVTANTARQLETKTWPELAKWHRLFIASHWFRYTATSIYVNDPDPNRQKTWRVDAVTWSETDTEAFAGLHNQGKRILLIFDEASAIADKVWEVAEGALTDKDTEIIWATFGNPTRRGGRFSECFKRYRHRWNAKRIDSRTVRHTNKVQIAKWIEDHGEDSDFVKIRVRGLEPNTSAKQFIGGDLVDAAKGKHLIESQYCFAATVIGVDPAYSGEDSYEVMLRQGLKSQHLGTFRGAQDDFEFAGRIARWEDEFQADAVFVDLGYGTGIVSGGKQLGRSWRLVAFGGASGKPGFKNKRAEMWGDTRQWLKDGGALPPIDALCDELTGPEFTVNLKGEIVLESKEEMKVRGLPSPNCADALALTFAFPVQPKSARREGGREFANQGREFANRRYDPYARMKGRNS
jgi:hypothetical protein